ncbi:MAG: NADPH-dependent 7-cyano-7-deazaguanine reductase QueF [Chloroflexi bacterium]|nr:NADPH-dependent 7-cyano-7-deazaguanine reductase QueF [Chloroflexota bacterium]
MRGEEAVRTDGLLAFDYDYAEEPAEVTIESDEFTAVCPWTGLPDLGRLTVRYLPGSQLIELKSLKYYLLSYRDVGIVQEHAAGRVLKDLAALVRPRWMEVTLDYNVRGGLRTVAKVRYPQASEGGAPD